MGVDAVAFFACPDEASRRAVERAVEPGAGGLLWQALREVRYGDGTSPHGPGMLHFWGRLLELSMPVRWRGFVSEVELREPMRVVCLALWRAAGASGPVIYAPELSLSSRLPAVDDPRRQSELPLEAFARCCDELRAVADRPRLSRTFRGWDVGALDGAYLETFDDLRGAADPFANYRRALAAREELHARCAQQVGLGATGALPASPTAAWSLTGDAAVPIAREDWGWTLDLTSVPAGAVALLLHEDDDLARAVFAPPDSGPLEIDHLFEIAPPEAGDAGVAAYRVGRFDALPWAGKLTAALDGERVARWVCDDGDLEASPVLEDGNGRPLAEHEVSPRGLMHAVERALELRSGPVRTLVIEGEVEPDCAAARFCVPASLVRAARRRGVALEVSLRRALEGCDLWV